MVRLLRILVLVQSPVHALAIQQLFVAALLYDAPFVQDNNAVNVADR